ncbi:MAG TPA: hypothetical protein VK689_05655 [Armatimonadota bacterium]|nr:hypothetical protein [Armatimonadota bacterium]
MRSGHSAPKAALRRWVLVGCILLSAPVLAAPVALRSGPQVGERPLPFTSNAVTGPYRGKQHCYVCELKDTPAVLVFARRMDDGSARLLRELRDAVRDHRKEKLFAWVVFLGGENTPSETALERQAYDFVRENNATSLPVCALGDPQGPPGYFIAPEADATVIMFRNGKVVSNRAYRAKDWGSRAAANALKDLPKLLQSGSASP